MTKVSVLFPVYNTPETFLRQALESVLHQSFTDFELIIINDASTTDVESIIKSYSDSRIKYYKNKHNLGISATRNLLIEKSSGEYLAIMDHDDISLPERFAREVEYLDTHPNVGVVSCWSKIIGSQATIKYPIDNSEIESQLLLDYCITHPAAMVRRSVLDNYHIQYETQFSPAEDYALWCRLVGKTEFHNLPEVLFMYRDHPDNTSHRQAHKMAKAAEAIRLFVRHDNPALWHLVSKQSITKTRIKLFNCIPLLTITRGSKYYNIKLFGIIPLLSSKSKVSV